MDDTPVPGAQAISKQLSDEGKAVGKVLIAAEESDPNPIRSDEVRAVHTVATARTTVLLKWLARALAKIETLELQRGEIERGVRAAVEKEMALQFNDRIEIFEKLVLEARGPGKIIRTRRDAAGNLSAVVSEPHQENATAMQARIEELEARLCEVEAKGIDYKDIWKPGEAYKKNNAVTKGGSMWIAICDNPSGEPGKSGEWKLAIKKGRDGKDNNTWPASRPVAA